MNGNATQLPGNLLDPTTRTVEPKRGQVGFTRMLTKTIDTDKRQIRFVCSTGDVDRYGEIIEPAAFADSIATFMLNPVFPAGHVYIGMSGEPTVLGSWVELRITDAGLEGVAEFDDEDELAIRYWNHYRKGRLRAVSVGFMAREWEMRDETVNGQQRRVRVFTKVDLLEISGVMIPANSAALMLAASAVPSAFGGDGGSSNLPASIQRCIEDCVQRAVGDAMRGGSVTGRGFATFHADGRQDSAEPSRGLRSFAAGYFGAIPDDGLADPHSESTADDEELKDCLRSLVQTTGAG